MIRGGGNHCQLFCKITKCIWTCCVVFAVCLIVKMIDCLISGSVCGLIGGELCRVMLVMSKAMCVSYHSLAITHTFWSEGE